VAKENVRIMTKSYKKSNQAFTIMILKMLKKLEKKARYLMSNGRRLKKI